MLINTFAYHQETQKNNKKKYHKILTKTKKKLKICD